MTMITEKYEITNEIQVASIYEFLVEFPEGYEAFQKRHPEYTGNDDDILNYIDSDMDEIEAILKADSGLWSVDYIEGLFFSFRQWEIRGEEE